jgi:hypothetical protein
LESLHEHKCNTIIKLLHVYLCDVK